MERRVGLPTGRVRRVKTANSFVTALSSFDGTATHVGGPCLRHTSSLQNVDCCGRFEMRESLMVELRAALILALLLVLAPVRADEAKKQKDAAPCIEVQVNGERIPAWDCLQRKLAPASKAAKSPALPEAERLMRQPGNQLMQYNLEGTRQRMGDAFGRSVVPQRPAR